MSKPNTPSEDEYTAAEINRRTYPDLQWTPKRVAAFWNFESRHPTRYFTYLNRREIIRRLRRYFETSDSILDYACGPVLRKNENRKNKCPFLLNNKVTQGHTVVNHVKNRSEIGRSTRPRKLRWPAIPHMVRSAPLCAATHGEEFVHGGGFLQIRIPPPREASRRETLLMSAAVAR